MALTMQRPRAIWIPLVLAGSVLYWTVALGLGGLSVSFISDSQDSQDEMLEIAPETTISPREEPIIVHLQTWSEARAMAPALGDEPPAPPVDDGTGSLPGQADLATPSPTTGPGATAY